MRPPQRGDVVVFTYPEQPRISYVKRVVGLPGDRIEIEKGELSINGVKLEYQELPETQSRALLQDFVSADLFQVVREKAAGGSRDLLFQKTRKNTQFGPLIVPPDEVFLLGDNRDSSDDSRYWGSVPIERLEGRVQWIWLSLDWQNRIWENRFPTVRWSRSGTSVH